MWSYGAGMWHFMRTAVSSSLLLHYLWVLLPMVTASYKKETWRFLMVTIVSTTDSVAAVSAVSDDRGGIPFFSRI